MIKCKSPAIFQNGAKLIQYCVGARRSYNKTVPARANMPHHSLVLGWQYEWRHGNLIDIYTYNCIKQSTTTNRVCLTDVMCAIYKINGECGWNYMK